jgi:hypothetical protein
MAVTYQIDADQKLIRTKCSGQVTLQEVIDHFRQLGQDPLCTGHLDVALDLSETTSLPESSQLQIVRQEVKRVSEHVRFGACAIVANRDALFGMMRVFEATTQEYFETACVFRSATEAEAWLRAQRSVG